MRRSTLLIAAFACLLAAGSSAAAAELPPNFQEEVALSGLVQPTVVRFSPDGRVFVAEKSGLIKVFDGLGDTTPTSSPTCARRSTTTGTAACSAWRSTRSFPADPYVYVLYTHDAAIGGTAPRWGDTRRDERSVPDPPGGDRRRLRRPRPPLAAVQRRRAPSRCSIEDWCQQFPSHSIGHAPVRRRRRALRERRRRRELQLRRLRAGRQPAQPLRRSARRVGAALTPPTAEGGALRAQDLRTAGDPVGLDGTIIRIDPGHRRRPPGQPARRRAPTPNARRIVAYGLRNPFRFDVPPGHERDLDRRRRLRQRYEEINRITDPLGDGRELRLALLRRAPAASPATSGST